MKKQWINIAEKIEKPPKIREKIVLWKKQNLAEGDLRKQSSSSDSYRGHSFRADKGSNLIITLQSFMTSSKILTPGSLSFLIYIVDILLLSAKYNCGISTRFASSKLGTHHLVRTQYIFAVIFTVATGQRVDCRRQRLCVSQSIR